jgi:hypothetical protein
VAEGEGALKEHDSTATHQPCPVEMVYKANCCIESALPAKPAEAIKKKRAFLHRNGALGQSGWFKKGIFFSSCFGAKKEGKKTIFFGRLPKNLAAKKLPCLPTTNYRTARNGHQQPFYIKKS